MSKRVYQRRADSVQCSALTKTGKQCARSATRGDTVCCTHRRVINIAKHEAPDELKSPAGELYRLKVADDIREAEKAQGYKFSPAAIAQWCSLIRTGQLRIELVKILPGHGTPVEVELRPDYDTRLKAAKLELEAGAKMSSGAGATKQEIKTMISDALGLTGAKKAG